FAYTASHRDLHSFPTRRSSDLRARSLPVAVSHRITTKVCSFFLPARAVETSILPSGENATGGSKGCSGVPRRRSSFPVSVSHTRSEEHTSELQSPYDLVCRLLL